MNTANNDPINFKILLLSLLFLLSACEDTEVDIPEGAFSEHIVDLQGEWKISRVRLNNIDITDQMDFTPFALTLNMDANGPTDFQLVSTGTPFLVTESGNWSFNDPAYPTTVSFEAAGEKRTADFTVPPVSTSSAFSLTFSLGCSDNEYIFEFAK